MATRVGIIRNVISSLNGNGKFKTYYADNSARGTGSMVHNTDGDALYKIPKWECGLSAEDRAIAVTMLKDHPDVKDAYLSRNHGSSVGGHIKVRFYGLLR